MLMPGLMPTEGGGGVGGCRVLSLQPVGLMVGRGRRGACVRVGCYLTQVDFCICIIYKHIYIYIYSLLYLFIYNVFISLSFATLCTFI